MKRFDSDSSVTRSFRTSSWTNEESIEGEYIKCAWLKKATNGLIKRWQMKLCALNPNQFLYFNKKSLKQPAGVFNFDQLNLQIPLKSCTIFVISPVGCSRKFTFKCESPNECKVWQELLTQYISISKGFLTNATILATQKNFWKFPQISEAEFLKQAETGDVLLFRSKHMMSKALRTVSRSKYDHVALVLKHQGFVAFLEATRIVGVTVLYWTQFMENQWHLLYNRIMFRKLKVKNPPEFEEIIKNFVEISYGKKFNANVLKLLGSRPTESEKGYFCSELVASAYKTAGILPSEIEASTYWPGNFAEERPIYLINASFSPLNQINFLIP